MTVDQDVKRRVVGDLSVGDDFLHPVTRDSSHNESMFFNFFDTERSIGGFLRIGNRPNERHAEMTFCLFLPDGAVVFQWAKPAIRGNESFEAAGLTFEVELPGERIAIRYKGDAVRLADPSDMVRPGQAFRRGEPVDVDLRLTCLATGPMIGSATGDRSAPIFLDGVGHYQQPCAYGGSVTLDGSFSTPLIALGVRDHSWGRRVWHDIHMDRSFWVCINPDLAFIACKTWTGSDNAPDVVGCIVEQGQVSALRRVGLQSWYRAGSAWHDAFRLDLEDERGRSWRLDGRALTYLPLRHRREGQPILHLGQAMSRFTLEDGATALGLSEYFDADAAAATLISRPDDAAAVQE